MRRRARAVPTAAAAVARSEAALAGRGPHAYGSLVRPPPGSLFVTSPSSSSSSLPRGPSHQPPGVGNGAGAGSNGSAGSTSFTFQTLKAMPLKDKLLLLEQQSVQLKISGRCAGPGMWSDLSPSS